jgi:hypothetical protein
MTTRFSSTDQECQLTLFDLSTVQPAFQPIYDPAWDLPFPEIPDNQYESVGEQVAGATSAYESAGGYEEALLTTISNFSQTELLMVVNREEVSSTTISNFSQTELLMVVDREEVSSTTISNFSQTELLMVVDDDEIPLTTIGKRSVGDGTGRITKRNIRKRGRDYKQYWYDWQYYQNGKLIGRSRYIPKRLLPRIQTMEEEKLPVYKILEVLGVKS